MVFYGDSYVCSGCGREKYWYNYPTIKGELKGSFCFNCIERKRRAEIHCKIYKLIMSAEKNKMADLRKHLFECMEQVKNKTMDIESAKAACMVAQTIINTARVEIDFLKLVGGSKKSEFFQIEDKLD